MLYVAPVTIPKQEQVSLVTMEMTVVIVTLESDLVPGDILMIPTRVETQRDILQIMETSTSLPWDTYWSSENKIKRPLKPFDMSVSVRQMQLGEQLTLENSPPTLEILSTREKADISKIFTLRLIITGVTEYFSFLNNSNMGKFKVQCNQTSHFCNNSSELKTIMKLVNFSVR